MDGGYGAEWLSRYTRKWMSSGKGSSESSEIELSGVLTQEREGFSIGTIRAGGTPLLLLEP